MSTFDYSVLCRHVAAETKKTTCQVEGSIPHWLEGFILYNGPGLTKVGETEFKHAFDSSAILQRFDIKNGNISYTTKFLQSNTFKKNEKANKITVSEFGTPGPDNKSPFSRFKNVFDFETLVSDNAISNIIKLGSHFFAVGDSPYYLEVDSVSLDVINRINLNKIFNLVTQNVHVHEEEDGYYTLGQAITLTGPKYSVIYFPKDGDIEKGKIVTSIATRWKLNPCYIHSIVLTKNYLIFIEPPLAVSIMELMANTLKNTPFIEGLHWKNEKTLFHIFSRSSWKKVSTKYVSDPFFFIHFSNAFEKEDHIIVDVNTYKDASLLTNSYITKLREATSNTSASFHEGFCPILKRFIIPLKVESMKENEELVQLQSTECSAKKTGNEIHLVPEVLSNLPFENPASNAKYSVHGNTFVWGMGPSPNRENYNQIDLETKETVLFKEEGSHTSPPIFVPSSNAEKEDDGVILSLLLTSEKENLVTLLILDAATLTEIARATVQIHTAFSMPLHGNFYPF